MITVFCDQTAAIVNFPLECHHLIEDVCEVNFSDIYLLLLQPVLALSVVLLLEYEW